MKDLSDKQLKKGVAFFAAAIDAVLIYNFSLTFSQNIPLFILRLFLTVFITAGIWQIFCYVLDSSKD